MKLSMEWKSENMVKHVASILVFSGFAAAAYLSAQVATQYLLDTLHLGLFLYHRFLSMLLFVFFLSINVGNLIVAYAAFYRSPEMVYYFTKPISHANLFLMKFLDNFFYSSVAFFLVAFSVLLGYGSYFHMTWVFYLRTMMLMMLPFMLISGCLAVIMLLVLMRFVVKVGVKKIITLLVVVYFGLLSAYFSLTNPIKLVALVWQHYPEVDQYYGNLDPPFTILLPNHWIAESLYWTMRGDTSYALSYTLILLVATALVFGVMMLIGKKIFYQSWMNSIQIQAGSPKAPRILKMFSFLSPPRIGTQTSVLLKKEFWQFLREPSQWIHFTIIVFLIMTFVGSISNINLRQSLPTLQTMSYLVTLVFNLFLMASIALRFAYPSMSVEGSSFWKILAAPVQRGKIYYLKFFVIFIPVVLLSELLVLFSHRSLAEYPWLVGIATVVMVAGAFGLVGLNMGAGTYFANFNEKNPIRIASSQSATLTFLMSLSFIVVVVAIIFLPLRDYFGYYLRGLPFNENILFYALLAVTLFSVLVGYGALKVGEKALQRDYR
jgi:ABC-2 type transport system permease protein